MKNTNLIKRLMPVIFTLLILLSVLLPVHTIEASTVTQQVLIGGTADVLSQTQTEYNTLVGSGSTGSWQSAANNRQTIPTSGTLSSFYIELSAAVAADSTFTFTVMKNEDPTDLAATVTAGNTTGSDTTHGVSFEAGDTVYIRSTYTGTPGTPAATWSTLWTGAIEGETILLSSFAASQSYVTYMPLQGYGGGTAEASTPEAEISQPMPTNGTLKKLYVKLDGDPGANPDAYTFMVRDNAADTTLTLTITADDTSGSDTAHTVSVTAGHAYNISVTPVNGPAVASKVWIGMVFEPTTNGDSVILGGSSADTLANEAYQYLGSFVGTTVWSTTESARTQVIQSCELQEFYVKSSGTPGAGEGWTFTIENESNPTGHSVSIIGTDTTGNDTAHTYSPSDGDSITVYEARTNTPTARAISWGVVAYRAPVNLTPPSISLWFKPNDIIDGANLPDRSGTGNNGTIVWGTADLTGTLTGFGPPATLTPTVTSGGGFIPTPTPSAPFRTTLTPKPFPGSDILEDIKGTTPNQIVWMLITGFIILVISLTASWAMKRFGSGTLFVKAGIIIACMGILVALDIYDLWMIIMFVLIAGAIAMASRQQGWN